MFVHELLSQELSKRPRLQRIIRGARLSIMLPAGARPDKSRSLSLVGSTANR